MPQFISPGLMVGAGIGNALSQGVDTFLKAKQMNQQNNFEKTKLGLMGAKEGYDVDSDTGLLKPNDYGQAIQTAKIAGAQSQAAQSQQSLKDINNEIDPNSDISKGMRGTASLWASDLQNSPSFKKSLSDPNSQASQGYQAFTSLINDPNTSAHTISRFLDKNSAISDLIGQEKINASLVRLGLRNDQITGKADLKADTDFKGSLQKITPYKEADEGYSSADALINLVNNATKNKTSAASLPTELANYASKGKRLHTSTIQAFTDPNSDLITRLESGISKSTTGTIPQDVAADISTYLNNEKQNASVQKANILKSEAEDFNKMHGRYPKIYDSNSQSQGLMTSGQNAPMLPMNAIQAEIARRKGQQ